MSDIEKAERPDFLGRIFTWQNYPWILLLGLLFVDLIIYLLTIESNHNLFFLLAPLLTIQIWALGVLPFIHKFKRGSEVEDGLNKGKNLGMILVLFIYTLNCVGNLYYLLILKQVRYYKIWEPLQPDSPFWSTLILNSLGLLFCGALTAWCIREFWQHRLKK